MKRLILLILPLLFLTSCYNTYHITTPEFYDNYIEETNSYIENQGYVKCSEKIDTLHGVTNYFGNKVCGHYLYSREYSFAKDTQNVSYILTFAHGTKQDEIIAVYVKDIQLKCSATDTNIYNKVKELETPPLETVKLISDATVLGTIIGTPFLLITGFLTYAAIFNHN